MNHKMILNFKLHMKTSQNALHLGTSYIILKVSNKTPGEKQEPFELRRGERETHGKNERDMEGKEKGRKQLKQT